MFWSAGGGGVRRYLETKGDWLMRRAGWRHTIVAPGADGAGRGDCGGWPLPLSGGYRLTVRRELAARAIAAQAPDLIEVGDPYRLAWSALDAARRLAVPTVAFCHSNPAAMAALLAGGSGTPASLARRAAGAYLRRIYRRFDLVLAPSESMARELRELGLAQVERQSLGVDTQVFHPARRDAGLRAALGLPADSRLLIYAGRFAAEKHLPTLVEAVRRLGPPYVLLAVGHGPLPPAGSRVLRLPREAQPRRLARLLASADVFVHAGDQETFGLAALEAMACGTPVVVRAAAGLAELAADGAGMAVDSPLPGDWAEALAAIFTVDRAQLAESARARAETLDWDCVMPALLHRYRRLIAPAAARRCA
jgi:alpha-1,6-mannosyltransferase